MQILRLPSHVAFQNSDARRESYDQRENSEYISELLLSQIYNRYVQQLYNYGMHACNDCEIVKEILQELFVGVRGQREFFVTERTVRFCLFKRFRDLVIRHCRVLKSRWLFGNAAAGPTGSERTEIICELSAPQREAILLKVYNEFSYQEVASIMNIKAEYAYTLVAQAVEILRRRELGTRQSRKRK